MLLLCRCVVALPVRSTVVVLCAFGAAFVRWLIELGMCPMSFVDFFGGLVGWMDFFGPPGAVWGTGRCIACQRLHGSQAGASSSFPACCSAPLLHGAGGWSCGLPSDGSTYGWRRCWIWGGSFCGVCPEKVLDFVSAGLCGSVYIVLLLACSSSPALMNHVMLLIYHSQFAFRGAQVLCH